MAYPTLTGVTAGATAVTYLFHVPADDFASGIVVSPIAVGEAHGVAAETMLASLDAWAAQYAADAATATGTTVTVSRAISYEGATSPVTL